MWSDLGQFSRVVANSLAVIVQACRARQTAFNDLGEREVGKRFVSFVAAPQRASEADARRVLRHLHRQAGLAHAGSIPQHDNRSVAGQPTIDSRANRAALGFPPYERGSLGEREWRNLHHHWCSLPMIGTCWRGFGARSWPRWRHSRRSKFPCNREIGVRLVAAEDTGPDAARQDVSQPGIALRDSFQHQPDRLLDALAGSFRSRPRSAITSAESNSAREFPAQRIDLLFRLHGVLDISQLLGFLQFFAQLGKPPPVGGLGLFVEHLARIT